MNIFEKLLNIQTELKSPKNRHNNFGDYKYRSAEDILEAVKPLCKKYNAVLMLFDTVQEIGGKNYIVATATLWDAEGDHLKLQTTAMAREAESKKGMDDSQVTGTASSYARKYALNGLFCIDDTKDADTGEYYHETAQNRSQQARTNSKAQTHEQQAKPPTNGAQAQNNKNRNRLMIEINKKIRSDDASFNNYSVTMKEWGKKSINELTTEELMKLKDAI